MAKQKSGELRCPATALIDYAKSKAQISCTIIAQLISAFISSPEPKAHKVSL